MTEDVPAVPAQVVPPAAGPAPSAGRRALWLAWRIVRIPLIVYGFVLLLFYFAQTWIIFAGRDSQGQQSAVVRPVTGTELVEMTTEDGDKVVGLFGPALAADGAVRPDARTRPTVLYFYGNAMHLKEAISDFHWFRRMGVNIMVAEYTGYGMSGGTAGESGCYATARAAYAHLAARSDVEPRKIVAAGWSLGGAVAIDLAAHRFVAGLVTLSTFTSMAEVGSHQYPFLPTALLLRHRFRSERKMSQVTCPVFLAHGTVDPFIPAFMMDRLAAAARGPVTRFPVAKAEHTDIFVVGGEPLRKAVEAFLNGL